MTESNRRKSIALRAAAELSVIIVGVTVALWADSWAAGRNERAVESARLQALSENIQQTLEALRNEQGDADAAVAMLRTLAASSAQRANPADVQDALMRGLFYVSVFRPELSVYDDLKNSGELSLLRDPALRRSLSALDSRLEQLRLQQEDMITVQQLNLDSYMIRRVDLRPILGRTLGVDQLSNLDLEDLGFLDEPEFLNLVLFKLDLAVQMSQEFERLDVALVEVGRSISSQLEE